MASFLTKTACAAALALAAPLGLVAPAPAAAQARADLAFPLDAAQRQRNFAAVAQELASTNAGLGSIARELLAALATQDVIEPYMAGYGMTAADLGDVLAMSYFSAIMLADGGRTDDPTRAQLQGLRQRIDPAAGNSFAGLSAQEKQQSADKMLFLMLVQQAVAEGLAGNPAQAQWIDEFATFNTELLGFDVRAARIGPAGLESPPPMPGTRSVPPTESAPAPSGDQNAILGVYYKSDLVFMAGGPAGSLNRFERGEVLFKDGTACWDCLGEFITGQMAQYRAEEPQNVGRWRRQGNLYVTSYPDDSSSEIEPDMLLPPARPGTALRGDFTTSGGSTIGGVDSYTSVSTQGFLSFSPDGRFRTSRSVSILGQSPGVGFAGYNEGDGALAGRYRADGYTIRFDYDNGTSETQSLLVFPEDPEYLVIDGTGYWVDDGD